MNELPNCIRQIKYEINADKSSSRKCISAGLAGCIVFLVYLYDFFSK